MAAITTITTMPTGTVTFLFTDIEGSTKLWDQQPRAMQAAVAHHDALLREAIEAGGGYVFKTVGDAFCAAFPTAPQALDAALTAQHALHSAEWASGTGRLKVRMALHTGVAEVRDNDYFGQPLNRVARLLSTGYGDQVLLSLATQQLVRDHLPSGISLKDLGEGGLKDLSRTEHVYQVISPDLPSNFPPLKSLDAEYLEPSRDGVDVPNPYKGLRAFQEADAPDFFGREALVERFLGRMAEEGPLCRFLAVVGPSGSGKSSVVRAGLVPALRQGRLTGSDRWLVVEMLPGAHPLEELDALLLSVAAKPPATLMDLLREDERGLIRAAKRVLPRDESVELVLLIDQFEEVFTLVEDEPARVHFLESLCAAVSDPRSRVRVIVTLRADFFDRPLLYPDPGELMRQRTVVVLPMSAEELERAIVEPARVARVSLEPELLASIIKDVGEQPGTLPLLQYALTELFERRKSKTMTLVAYQESGGVVGALSRRADEIYGSLSPEEGEAARQLFLRLVTLGEGVEDTRRRVRRVELDALASNKTTMERVIEAFGRYRLLTFDMDPVTKGPTVEVAHEALIRNWGRLREWLDASRADLRTQRKLMGEATEWERSSKDRSYLSTGARLAQFEVLAEGASRPGGIALTSEEREYLQASIDERDRQAKAEQERQAKELELARQAAEKAEQAAQSAQQAAKAQRSAASRLRYLVAGLAIFLVVAIILSGFAVNRSQVADNNSKQAQSAAATAEADRNDANTQRGLAVQSAATAQADLSRSEAQRLAAEANRLDATGRTDSQLIGNLAIRSLNTQYTSQGDEALGAALVLPYPRLVFTEHTVIPNVLGGRAWFSPDGRYVSSYTRPDITAIYWDAQTGKEAARFQGDPNTMLRAAFSPDGKTILSTNKDFTLTIWDAATHQPLHVLRGHTGLPTFRFSADGKYIISLGSSGDDTTARLWDAQTGALLQTFIGHTQPLTWGDVSADGKQVLTVSNADGTVRVWDVATGKEVQRFGITSNGGVISPDGKQVLVTDVTDAVLYDVASGKELKRLIGLSGDATSVVAFSPDGKLGLVGAWDSTVRLWDLQTGKEIRRSNAHPGGVLSVQFAPDGRSYLTMGADEVVALWGLQPSTEYPVIHEDPAGLGWVSFSEDGTWVVTIGSPIGSQGSTGQAVRLWNVSTGDLVTTMTSTTSLNWLDFSPDDKTIATVSGTTVQLREVATGKELHVFTETLPLGSVQFSLDGRSLLLAGADASQQNTLVSVVDIATGKPLYRVEGPIDQVVSVNAVFSPDGKEIFSIGGGNGLLRDAVTGREIWHFTSNAASNLYSPAYSRDGRYVMACSPDAYIWDAHTGALVRKIAGRPSLIFNCTFSRDSTSVLTSGSDNAAHLWDIASGQEIRRFAGFSSGVLGTDIAPDGKRIVVGLSDGTVHVAPVDYRESMSWLCGKLWRDLTADERALYEVKDTKPTCQGN
jgi:WD40 repeat protein/class 3 adenylate cyclase